MNLHEQIPIRGHCFDASNLHGTHQGM
jgi:hypothetical protein